MNIGKLSPLATTIALVLCLGTADAAQEQTKTAGADASNQTILEQFHSSDWHVRSSAFYKLVRPLEDEPPNAAKLNHGKQIDPTIRNALISLLSFEADVVAAKERAFEDAIAAHRSPDVMSEEQSEYWATLNQAVGGLNDPRALDVLLKPSVISGGYNNTHAIAQFGAPVLPRLILLYRMRPDKFSRDYLTVVFADILRSGTVTDESTLKALKEIFLTRSYDSDRGTRLSALAGLIALFDSDSKARVREIASSDPYTFVNPRGQAVFPLREQAELLLHHRELPPASPLPTPR